MMKILFFQWHSFMNKGIERALIELNVDYDTFFYQFDNWEEDEKFEQELQNVLNKKNYGRVLSVNFAPLVSKVCEKMGIRYTSWIYDSPLHIRDLSVLNNSCNDIYFFDRAQAEIHKKDGANAKHLPLAVDTEVFGKLIKENDGTSYKVDISLVGKLYQTEYAYYTRPLSTYMQGYLEGLISAQSKIYGGYLIPELITDKLLARINAEYGKAADGFQMGRRELEYLLACETTGRERYMILALLSNHYKVDLYSTDEENGLKNVRFRGYADYYTQMPLIFANSKINLHNSLKTIQTGIPLRVVDIMGCGGFVLTNYQPELEEYFDISKECAVYQSMEEAYELTKYYMENDTERRKVALAGYERVKRDFTFKSRVKKLLNI